MDVTIRIPPELKPKLEAEAQRLGKKVSRVIEEILASAFSLHPTLDDLLAPARKEFAESGPTEDELDALIRQERSAMAPASSNGQLETVLEPPIKKSEPMDLTEIDRILDELARGGESLPPLPSNFSREDIYFDPTNGNPC
jgi:hypothetical protein